MERVLRCAAGAGANRVRHNQSGRSGPSAAAAKEREAVSGKVCGCGVLLAALCLFAQPSRDDYRAAYRNWREADPTLESDSGTGGAAIGSRANRAAGAATEYGAARSAFLNASAEEIDQRASRLEGAAAAASSLESTQLLQDHVTAEIATVGRDIETYAGDADPGIQQLRQVLDRERLALGALSGALAESQKTAGVAQDKAAAVEEARLKALGAYRELSAGLKQTSAQIARETEGWTDYYQKLSDGAVRQGLPAPAPGPELPPPAPPKEEPPARRPGPSITPLPLPRYTGAWIYPSVNGLYHGLQPEFIDLVVHEDNGHASGTLFARFKLPPGAAGDAEMRFDFSGEFKNTRNQTFTLETSDGAKGTIDLIPGAAFNLLEVNFQAEARPGKLRQGNFVLVKK